MKINTINRIAIYFSVLITTIFLSSCLDNDVPTAPAHEHEEPTKITLRFENANTPSSVFVYSYQVVEGSTEQPTVAISNLTSGIYKVSVQLFSNEEDITDEIFGEDKDDHFVFYQTSDGNNVQISYADNDVIDSNNNKVGKNTIWNITPGNSNVTVYLLHQPNNKNPNATSTSQLGGEIDLESKFSILVP